MHMGGRCEEVNSRCQIYVSNKCAGGNTRKCCVYGKNTPSMDRQHVELCYTITLDGNVYENLILLKECLVSPNDDNGGGDCNDMMIMLLLMMVVVMVMMAGTTTT